MEDERLFNISPKLRVLVRKSGLDTYLIIESNDKIIVLDLEKWKKFKKYLPVINTEFNLRLDG